MSDITHFFSKGIAGIQIAALTAALFAGVLMPSAAFADRDSSGDEQQSAQNEHHDGGHGTGGHEDNGGDTHDNDHHDSDHHDGDDHHGDHGHHHGDNGDDDSDDDTPPPPVDLCSNIDDVQLSVPAGYQALDGVCTLIPVDLCSNIDGVQTSIPEGDTAINGVCAPTIFDHCSNIDGVQASVPEGYTATEAGVCTLTTVTPTDVCPNIDGIQESVPSGKQITDGQCIDIPSGNGGNNENNGGGNTQNGDNTPAPQSFGGPVGGNGPIAGSFGGGNGAVLGAQTSALPELPASCTALLHTYMRMGKQNDTEEVKKLQNFLNEHMDAQLPVSGVFGPLTDKAVRNFQKKHTPQVLAPWGIADSTGYVYKTTQRWVNLVQCSTLTIPMPNLQE